MSIISNRFLIHRVQESFIKETLEKKRFGTVVDIGAGKAPYKHIFDYDKYIGIDVENRGGADVIADANKELPLESDMTDLIISTETIEHLKKPEVAINEMYRILKKDGMLVLTTPMTWLLHEEPNDFYRYTKYGLKHLLEEAGFKNIKIEPSNNYYYSLFQLLSVPLHNKLFIPVVLILNLLGLLSEKLLKSEKLTLDYQVIAFK